MQGWCLNFHKDIARYVYTAIEMVDMRWNIYDKRQYNLYLAFQKDKTIAIERWKIPKVLISQYQHENDMAKKTWKQQKDS